LEEPVAQLPNEYMGWYLFLDKENRLALEPADDDFVRRADAVDVGGTIGDHKI
jgi:hypothetical protein